MKKASNKKILKLMKLNKLFFLSLILGIFIISSCKKNDNEDPNALVYKSTKAYSLSNVSYGSSEKQKMDIFLPANRDDSSTKVFVLVHGGGWSGGDKNEMTETFNNLKNAYSDHAVINLNYRLGTIGSPGYPKQIQDIQKAISEIQKPEYGVSNQYLFYGISAGGHLSLLYGYSFDPNHEVKGICNVVGPSDLTDPAFDTSLTQDIFIPVLIGNVSEPEKTILLNEVSPAKHVTSSSPPTISFYGTADPLVPETQLSILHDELDNKGVYNQATLFQGNTHGGWQQAWTNDLVLKFAQFVGTYFQ